MAELSNKVFISYRRDVAGIYAMALYDGLAQRGIDAFYDIESIRAGEFEPVIFGQIAARPYFVLVLTPGSLKRCTRPDDWVRREMEHAVAEDRIIIPAHTPKFSFDDFDRYVPHLAAAFRGFNAIALPQEWFKYAVEKLAAEFLVPVFRPSALVPAPVQRVVDRITAEAERLPAVTTTQLSALEYFERAYARPDTELGEQIADYTEAIRLDPTFAPAYNNRGNAKDTLRDSVGAIADHTEAIRLNPTFALAYINRGFAKVGLGDVVGAVADYDEAIRLDPTDAIAYYNRGNAKAALGDSVGAVADYDEAIRLDPALVIAYLNRGPAKRALGDSVGAIADYTEAIRLNPTYAFAYNNRGLAKGDLGDFVGAIADYTEAIRLDPTDTFAYNNRGLAKGDLGDFVGAIADYTEAIRLDSTNAAAYNNRGLAKKGLGDFVGATADYDEAIRLAPTDAFAYYNRSVSRERLGDLEGALADVRTGQRFAPDDPDFPNRIESLSGRQTRRRRRR